MDANYQKWLQWHQRNSGSKPDIAETVGKTDARTSNIDPYFDSVRNGVAGSGGLTSVFHTVGTTGSNMIRNDNQYGVASSDAQAGLAAGLDPGQSTKRVFSDIGEGNWGKAIGRAFNLIGGAVQDNRDKRKAQKQAEQDLRNWNAAQRTPTSGNAQPVFRSPQPYYDLNQNNKLLKMKFETV